MIELASKTYGFEMPSGDIVEIGDKVSPDFKPHIKLNRWNGECAIDLELVTTKKILPVVQADKIIWDDNKTSCEFLPQPPNEKAELGGFKFNIILKEKPKTNVSSLKFKAKGLKFYYQPELTPEEIAEGCVRPENVVGSYAVYHATRTNMHASKADAEKYKCGKAFHWYRPLIWDSSNPRKEVWGKLNVDPAKEIRTVTIPQDFLDSAVYPITIDDDFGYTGAGVSWNESVNIIRGGVHTGAAGTGISMTCSCQNSFTSFRLGLYKDSDDSFVMGTNQKSALNIRSWVSADFTSAPTLEAIDYILAFFHGSPWDVRIYYDVEADKWWGYESATYPNWPETASWTNYSDKVYSIYCTYTPAVEEQELIASPVAAVSSIQVGAVAGSGIAPLTGTFTQVASSIQASAIAGTGIAPLTAVPVSITSSVVTGTIENVAVVVQELVASPLLVTSSVVAANITFPWVIECITTRIVPSRLDITRVPVSRLEMKRLASSRLPLCRKVRRYL